MINVKLSWPYPNWNLIRQTPQASGVWGDCRFFINQEVAECDWWFIFGFLPQERETVNCPATNTVLFASEPPEFYVYDQKFIRQFHWLISSHAEINHPRKVCLFSQGFHWFVGAKKTGDTVIFSKSYDELSVMPSLVKTKKLSVVASDKQITLVHKKRYSFVKAVKSYFGGQADLFGHGFNEVADKWDALAPYEFTVAIENDFRPDYATEKLFDCYLAQTMPFYYGCSNLNKYFAADEFIALDLDDLDGSIKKIEGVLSDDTYYQRHLPALLRVRDRCLNEYNIFPLMVNFIKRQPLAAKKKKKIVLANKPAFSWKRFL